MAADETAAFDLLKPAMRPCREAGLQGWRSSPQFLAPPVRTAGAPPGPGKYQVTNLIESIESRLRDSVTGESGLAVQPKTDRDEASEAAAAMESSHEDFVGVNTEWRDQGQPEVGSNWGEHGGRNESGSIVSVPKLNISLSHNKTENDKTVGDPNSGRLKSIDKRTEDILIVLSVDDVSYQRLEDTALLWQVRSLCVLMLQSHSMACVGCHISLSVCRERQNSSC